MRQHWQASVTEDQVPQCSKDGSYPGSLEQLCRIKISRIN